MLDKRAVSLDIAVAGIEDGATVLIGGFGEAGSPTELIHALIDQGARNLTVVNNNAGTGEIGLAALLAARRVSKMICSYPRSSNPYVFDQLYAAGEIELELNPQGTLAERIRAGGSGIGAFFTPTGADTEIATGKETRIINGRKQILETSLRGDVALIKAEAADRWGNLVYRKAGRNFGPIMCMAADLVIVQVRRVVNIGELDPEAIVTPSVFVDRIVEVPDPINESDYVSRARAAV